MGHCRVRSHLNPHWNDLAMRATLEIVPWAIKFATRGIFAKITRNYSCKLNWKTDQLIQLQREFIFKTNFHDDSAYIGWAESSNVSSEFYTKMSLNIISIDCCTRFVNLVRYWPIRVFNKRIENSSDKMFPEKHRRAVRKKLLFSREKTHRQKRTRIDFHVETRQINRSKRAAYANTNTSIAPNANATNRYSWKRYGNTLVRSERFQKIKQLLGRRHAAFFFAAINVWILLGKVRERRFQFHGWLVLIEPRFNSEIIRQRNRSERKY